MAPDPPAVALGEVVRVSALSQVPLSGHRVDAKPGDWLLRARGHVAVVAADTGRVIDFGENGQRDGLTYLDPVAFEGLSELSSQVEHIAAVGAGSRVLYVRRRLLERPLALHVWYAFDGSRLLVESLLSSRSDEPLAAVTLGERAVWGNVPSWMAGHGFIDEAGAYGGDFLARGTHGAAYALCSTTGRLMARFKAPVMAGFHRSARTGERVVELSPKGQTPRRRVLLSYRPGSLGHAAAALPCVAASQSYRWPLSPPDPLHSLEVARCPAVGQPAAPYAQFRYSEREPGFQLPAGCFTARLHAPGHLPGPWFQPGRPGGAIAPVAGRLRFLITAGGSIVPAKLLVRGVGGTADPDWGEGGQGSAVRNFAYSAGQGELPLPPGRYRVSVQRGPEYTAHVEEIEVTADGVTTLRAELERVVDTGGWISADLHVHAIPSSDAPTLLADRVRSLAAVNVEVAVASDHNAVTDYGPAIAALGLQRSLTSIIGDEVTTSDVATGHFNVFPLAPGSGPLDWENVGPRDLFRAARARAATPLVIQVNHPRMGGIGYLELFRFDRGAVRHSVQRSPALDMGFDALEVFNGDYYDDVEHVEQVLRDWMGLAGAGYRYVATGNSDSHKIGYHEAGVPRNWVWVGNDDPAALPVRTFIDGLRASRVVVSSGPFLTLTAAGQPIGSTVGAGVVDVAVEVQCPPWIRVDELEIWIRGQQRQRWEVSMTPEQTRLTKRKGLRLQAGDWLIAIARGSQPMEHLYRKGATPFAFTNPIWVK